MYVLDCKKGQNVSYSFLFEQRSIFSYLLFMPYLVIYWGKEIRLNIWTGTRWNSTRIPVLQWNRLLHVRLSIIWIPITYSTKIRKWGFSYTKQLHNSTMNMDWEGVRRTHKGKGKQGSKTNPNCSFWSRTISWKLCDLTRLQQNKPISEPSSNFLSFGAKFILENNKFGFMLSGQFRLSMKRRIRAFGLKWSN